jgi:hypothetical protein
MEAQAEVSAVAVVEAAVEAQAEVSAVAALKQLQDTRRPRHRQR